MRGRGRTPARELDDLLRIRLGHLPDLHDAIIAAAIGDDVVMALPVRLDHCVIHVSDWEVSNAFYRDVVGAELVESDGRTAYRFGAQQLNLHGPGHVAGAGGEAARSAGQQ